MPRGDRTGPNGLGPLTGRRAGYCAGYNVPGFMNRPYGGFGAGRGRGLGLGFGRGIGARAGGRRRFFQAGGYYGYGAAPYPYEAPYYGGPVQEAPPVDEREYLNKQRDYIQEELSAINKRLDELEEEQTD